MAGAASKKPKLASSNAAAPKARTRPPLYADYLPARPLEPGAKPRTAKMQAMLTQIERAVMQAERSKTPVRLSIVVEPGKRSPKLDVETLGLSDDLDLAFSEAHARGAARATEILTGPDMLGADDFARLIGMTREAVRQKLARREILGLQGAKRGVRYPAWQVTRDGALLPSLPHISAILGDSPWVTYRFLTQSNPAFKGKPPLDSLRAGEVAEVIAAAEANANGDFG